MASKRRSKDNKGSNAKKKRKQSGSEDDGPAFLSSKYAERPTSKIYNSHFRNHTPAELFRKDLISAMKMPDSEPLSADEYVEIDDPWRPEWEKGVQVPVDPDSLPEPTMRILRKRNKNSNFKLPKKLIRFTRDNFFNPDIHVMSYTNTLAERTCRYDMDDVDLQWLSLVNQDREDFGLQPLEETAIEQIIEEFEVQSYVNFQETIKSEEGLGLEYDEDAICDVCRSPDSTEDNEMVFCDSCNICVHQLCYGITKIPEGSWICRTCTLGIRPACVLCPNRGGAMKTTRSGQKWAHVGCAIWIPEVQFLNYIKMEPIIKISQIKPERWTLICAFCKEKTGVCIKCYEKSCKTTFHVTCGFKEGLKMIATIKNTFEGDELQAFCHKHSKKRLKFTSGSDLEQSGNQIDDQYMSQELSSEDRANLRQKKIQDKEAEFYNYVSVNDIAELFQYDKCDIELIYNYWKLKRKANWNRPLLPPKIDSENSCSMENSQYSFLKKLVHHRQDLERARNLCYMVIKREKLASSWVRCKEATFVKQSNILSKKSKKLSKEEIEAVLNAGCGDLAYDKKFTGNRRPSPNASSVLNNLVGEKLSKFQFNGVIKNRKSEKVKREKIKSERTPNPYAKHYLNGLLKRSQRWLADKQKITKVEKDEAASTAKKPDDNINSNDNSANIISTDDLDMSITNVEDFDLNLLDDRSFFHDSCENSFSETDRQNSNLETFEDMRNVLLDITVKSEPPEECDESITKIQEYLKDSCNPNSTSDCENYNNQLVNSINVVENFQNMRNNPKKCKSNSKTYVPKEPSLSENIIHNQSITLDECSVKNKHPFSLRKVSDIDDKLIRVNHINQEIKIEISDVLDSIISDDIRGLKNVLNQDNKHISQKIKCKEKLSIEKKSGSSKSLSKGKRQLDRRKETLKKSKDLTGSKFKRKPLQDPLCEESLTGDKDAFDNDILSKNTIVQNKSLEENTHTENSFEKMSLCLEDSEVSSIDPPSPKSNPSNKYDKSCVNDLKNESSVKVVNNFKLEIKDKAKVTSDSVCNKETIETNSEVITKSSPVRTNCPTSSKLIENKPIRANKVSQKHNKMEKSHKKSNSASKLLKAIHLTQATSSHVNKQRMSSSSQSQEKASSVKSFDSDSSEIKQGSKDKEVVNSDITTLTKKDSLRGYKIPKKPKFDKPEGNSLDLKRGSSPLSPLPEIASTHSGYSTASRTSWRTLTPRTTPAPVPPTNDLPSPLSNGNAEPRHITTPVPSNHSPQTLSNGRVESLSKELVMKNKKEPPHQNTGQWKTENFRRRDPSAMCVSKYPSNHNNLYPQRFPSRPQRYWTNERNRNQYLSMHAGYGHNPHFT